MKILILASNPRNDLNLDREIRDLKEVIEKSRNRQDFDVEDALAVRVGDLQDLFLRHQPQIVHFCGHGSGREGLVFEGSDGSEQWVRTEALSGLFRLFSNDVGCVLLNACYSEAQADAIVEHIDYVIGMNQEIRDDAAIAFAKGFYRGLGYECSIERSFELGKNVIQLEISGSSKVRSAVGDAARKAEVVDAINQTPLLEHLKPILKIKKTLTSSLAGNSAAPDQSLAEEARRTILLEIDKSLEVEKTAILTQSFSFKVAAVAVTEGLSSDASSLEISYRDGKADYLWEKLEEGIGLAVVAIPGGIFTMGSPSHEKERHDSEGPQHLVKVRPFYMGKYAITQEQWFTVAHLPKVKLDLNPDPSHFKGVNRPVEQVSWHEATEFCDRLSRKTGRQYRLPSEAEWEYACRAGTTTPFYVGETITADLANYDGNCTYGAGFKGKYREQTTDVGSFAPNGFGLYDMHGNVEEWCQDHRHGSYQGAPADGSAWIDQDTVEDVEHCVRGGSWFGEPVVCRSAHRSSDDPHESASFIGIRVVCVAIKAFA
ncbi:SUMF1/EgtB/PvdO family nonheme iron enzyme [Nodosilinea nodulosa]|uniref:SUMF1/EgtB/PvdO family nonheme iron enzyme n=1 Tax=Nodosilinea nodulosa TaxID=416001 RepID=UPI00030140EA|nr:SUMF1/EgtB/PvdO family nonheme iron enzyme [Nodosilinea nodulosa]